MTPERVSELMTAAYRAMGYRVFMFPDGSKGVLKCSGNAVVLMTKFAELICDELEKEAKKEG